MFVHLKHLLCLSQLHNTIKRTNLQIKWKIDKEWMFKECFMFANGGHTSSQQPKRIMRNVKELGLIDLQI